MDRSLQDALGQMGISNPTQYVKDTIDRMKKIKETVDEEKRTRTDMIIARDLGGILGIAIDFLERIK